MTFRDPEQCPTPGCKGETRVTHKRNSLDGIIWRRHVCLTCGHSWPSWQSLVNPRDVDQQDIDPRATT